MDKTFGHNQDSWISVQYVTWDSVQVRYSLPQFKADVTASIIQNGEEIQTQSAKGNNMTGVFRFSALTPDTEYTYCISTDEDKFQEKFRTLPRPQGRHIFKMGILADPHLSCCGFEMKGRLHSECGVIVRLMLEDMTARGCELLVSPGDIVNAGLPEEYALAADLLRSCPLPFHVTPGNHDIPNDGWQHFRRQFGSGTWLRQLHGFQFAALETGDGLLDKPENMELLSAMDETRPLLLFTHYQLFPDQWIPDANRAISDAAAPNCVKMLEKLARCSGIVYVGHKNVAAQVKINRLVQLNTPQPTHFPAGYLLADFYEDGVWHQFVPLASEVLNEYSRLGTEHSKPHFKEGCCCRSEYRDRFTKDVWNQVITIA